MARAPDPKPADIKDVTEVETVVETNSEVSTFEQLNLEIETRDVGDGTVITTIVGVDDRAVIV
jgi:hypothetical protein